MRRSAPLCFGSSLIAVLSSANALALRLAFESKSERSFFASLYEASAGLTFSGLPSSPTPDAAPPSPVTSPPPPPPPPSSSSSGNGVVSPCNSPCSRSLSSAFFQGLTASHDLGVTAMMPRSTKKPTSNEEDVVVDESNRRRRNIDRAVVVACIFAVCAVRRNVTR